jgi:DNA polymerase-1
MLKVRELSKLISTYFKAFWDEDERCRCSWLIHGTETGRLSSASNIKGTGLNMQNQVPRYRDVFVADEGCSLIKIDLSQVEARLVAYLSKSPHMIAVFEEGRDIHSMVASMVLGVPINQITKESRERGIGKKCVHSANYLIGPYLFASLIGVSNPEGKRLLERYYGIFQIKDWHSRVEEEIKKTRTLTTPFGRKRRFFDRYGDDLLRAAVAYIPQSTASDHINRAAVRIYPQLPEGASILLQVHDEIVIQAKTSDLLSVVELAKRELSTPIPIDGQDVIIPIDIQAGENWKDGVKI